MFITRSSHFAAATTALSLASLFFGCDRQKQSVPETPPAPTAASPTPEPGTPAAAEVSRNNFPATTVSHILSMGPWMRGEAASLTCSAILIKKRNGDDGAGQYVERTYAVRQCGSTHCCPVITYNFMLPGSAATIDGIIESRDGVPSLLKATGLVTPRALTIAELNAAGSSLVGTGQHVTIEGSISGKPKSVPMEWVHPHTGNLHRWTDSFYWLTSGDSGISVKMREFLLPEGPLRLTGQVTAMDGRLLFDIEDYSPATSRPIEEIYANPSAWLDKTVTITGMMEPGSSNDIEYTDPESGKAIKTTEHWLSVQVDAPGNPKFLLRSLGHPLSELLLSVDAVIRKGTDGTFYGDIIESTGLQVGK